MFQAGARTAILAFDEEIHAYRAASLSGSGPLAVDVPIAIRATAVTVPAFEIDLPPAVPVTLVNRVEDDGTGARLVLR
jgi:hypothetical protein